MNPVVLIHWPGLHHSQVDSAIMDQCVATWGAELAAVANGHVKVFRRQYHSLDHAMESMPTKSWVFLVPQSDLPSKSTPYFRLHEYPHPRDAVYVVGADSGFGFQPPAAGGDFVIIETPHGLNHSMWSYQAISVVLYDRWLKEHG